MVQICRAGHADRRDYLSCLGIALAITDPFLWWGWPLGLRLCWQRTTFGFPSPQMARQMVTHVVMAWQECPHDTACVFLLPRVFQRWWRRTNKALLIWALMVDAADLYPTDVFEAEIPFILLILPPHIPYLPSVPNVLSLDRSTLPDDWREHDEQAAEYLRGL
eukprot:scaffold87546_cov40-Attheya_sp.AAC.1